MTQRDPHREPVPIGELLFLAFGDERAAHEEGDDVDELMRLAFGMGGSSASEGAAPAHSEPASDAPTTNTSAPASNAAGTPQHAIPVVTLPTARASQW